MSFIGRAEVWTHVNGALNDGHRSNRRAVPIGARLTPLEVMTGSRLAASGIGSSVSGQTWDESLQTRPAGSRHIDVRPQYQHLFQAIGRRTNRVTEPPRSCPRCGQAPHNDWGHEYERLICQEITAA